MKKNKITCSNYKSYLRSPHWVSKREEYLSSPTGERSGKKCIVCGNSRVSLHHLTYDTLYRERVAFDFVLLCGDCHKLLHEHLKDYGLKAENSIIVLTHLMKVNIRDITSFRRKTRVKYRKDKSIFRMHRIFQQWLNDKNSDIALDKIKIKQIAKFIHYPTNEQREVFNLSTCWQKDLLKIGTISKEKFSEFIHPTLIKKLNIISFLDSHPKNEEQIQKKKESGIRRREKNNHLCSFLKTLLRKKPITFDKSSIRQIQKIVDCPSSRQCSVLGISRQSWKRDLLNKEVEKDKLIEFLIPALKRKRINLFQNNSK